MLCDCFSSNILIFRLFYLFNKNKLLVCVDQVPYCLIIGLEKNDFVIQRSRYGMRSPHAYLVSPTTGGGSVLELDITAAHTSLVGLDPVAEEELIPIDSRMY